MVALLTMILAQMLKFMGIPLVLAVPLILIVGGVLGVFIGLITAYGRIPSFITTLAGIDCVSGSGADVQQWLSDLFARSST